MFLFHWSADFVEFFCRRRSLPFWSVCYLYSYLVHWRQKGSGICILIFGVQDLCSLALFKAALSPERHWRGPRSQEVWGREGLYPTLHCHHQDSQSALRWSAVRAVLMFHGGGGGKVTEQCLGCPKLTHSLTHSLTHTHTHTHTCLLYTSPSPRDVHKSRMPSSA